MIIYCPRVGIYREMTREKTRDETRYVPIHVMSKFIEG